MPTHPSVPFRPLLAALLAAVLALPPVALAAPTKSARKNWTIGAPVPIPDASNCAPLPPAGEVPWKTGERLSYDIDVLGANAGKLVLLALPSVGKGKGADLQLRSLAASNSFFSKIRRVRGRSTSYVRARDLHPRRYEESTTEGKVKKGATIIFKKKSEGATVRVDWMRNKIKGKRNLRYLNEAFDPVSAAYYLRAIELKAGMPLCFDAYSIRSMWRTSGVVKGLETVTVPAGTFQAWHIEGRSVRTDNARSHREVHIWISADAQRLPLAALGVIDLGPVRAQLTRIDVSKGDDSEDKLANEAVVGKGTPPKATVAPDEEEAEEELPIEVPVTPPAAPTTPASAPATPTTDEALMSPVPTAP